MDIISGGADGARSLIVSTAELAVREGMMLDKSLNFRDGAGVLSVMLVLLRDDGYREEWREEDSTLILEGHDSVAEGAQGKVDDQLLMYASGNATENGKFYKAANAYKDGLRGSPLQVQVYEKLDSGVWFDKGIFNLINADYASDGTRKVARFHLVPADASLAERVSWCERMLPAAAKADAWKQSGGRCAMCRSEAGLHFVTNSEGLSELRCSAHF